MVPQVIDFITAQFKHEIFRESPDISSHLPLQIFCCYTVHFCQISVQHDLLFANNKYLWGDFLFWYHNNIPHNVKLRVNAVSSQYLIIVFGSLYPFTSEKVCLPH